MCSVDLFIKQGRRWEPLYDCNFKPPAGSCSGAHSGGGGACHRFTLVSYNVLSQRLMLAHPELYVGASRADCAWRERLPRVWQQIAQLTPDVVCLQEVEEADIPCFWRPLCDQTGMELTFKRRTGSSKTDGCALLWQQRLFELVHVRHVELKRPGCGVLNRDNVAIVARLRSRVSGAELVVCTTHLLFNPRRSDVRLAQCAVIMSEIGAVLSADGRSSSAPVILCGDFNLEPTSPICTFLSGEPVRYAGMSRATLMPTDGRGGANLSAPLLAPSSDTADNYSLSSVQDDGASVRHSLAPLRSVYPGGCDSSLLATTRQDSWITVDYVFVADGGGGEAGRLRPVSRLQLPEARQCQQLRPYPSLALPSDHLPLAVQFELRAVEGVGSDSGGNGGSSSHL